MGFLQKLCPSLTRSSHQPHYASQSLPHSYRQVSSPPRQPQESNVDSLPSHTRHSRQRTRRDHTPSGPPQPQSQPTQRLRHRSSEAHIQVYPSGSFGPPIVTTGPPLREQWINYGTKKKFVYSNADVVWRSNERNVAWAENQETAFEDQTRPRPSRRDFVGENIGNHHSGSLQRGRVAHHATEEEVPIRRHPARDSLRRTRRYTQSRSRLRHHPIIPPDMAQVPYPTQTFFQPQRPSQIHPDLQFITHQTPYPHMHWNIISPVYTAVRYHLPCAAHTGRHVSPLDLSASATNPPSRQMEITVDCHSLELSFWMGLWGPIWVDATTAYGGYVTLGSLLGAIYDYFSVPLKPNELGCVPEHWRGILEEAKRKRLKTVNSHLEFDSGYVRADLLNGNSRFAGLTWDTRGTAPRWVLNLQSFA